MFRRVPTTDTNKQAPTQATGQQTSAPKRPLTQNAADIAGQKPTMSPMMQKNTQQAIGEKPMTETKTETVDVETPTENTTAPKKNLDIPASARRPGMPGAMPQGGLMGFGQAPSTPTMGQTQTTNTTGFGHNSGQTNPEGKRLVIGEGISISGDINSCEYLVVEGSVKSDFKGSDRLDISQSGVFKGSAETKDADIAGEFDGTLIVNGRLTVRSGGQIKGTIYYKELAVEAGSMIEGKLNFLTEDKKASSSTTKSKKTTKTTKAKKETKEEDTNVTQMSLATGE